MALRLRRGTDAQRQLITPIEGELIYVTDTTELYVGDGTTLGGVRITGEVVNQLSALNDVDAALPQDGDVLIYDGPTGDWVSGELPLDDLSNVDTTGILDGQVLAWDATSSSFTPSNNIGGDTGTFVGDLVGSVFSDDSSVVLDSINRTLNIDSIFALGAVDAGSVIAPRFTGELTGNVNGTLFGDVEGDLKGSVFSDDSTVLLDGINRTLNVDSIFVLDAIDASSIVAPSITGDLVGSLLGDVDGNVTGTLTGNVIGNVTGNVIGNVTGNVTGTVTGELIGDVKSDDSTVLIDSTNRRLLGEVRSTLLSSFFDMVIEPTGGFDPIVKLKSGSNTGTFGNPILSVYNNHTGTYGQEITFSRSNGTYASPTAATSGDYVGSLTFRVHDGNDYTSLAAMHVVADTVTGTDDVASKIDFYTRDGAIASEYNVALSLRHKGVEATGYVKFGSFTTTERDALTAANGMVIYNTSTNKFQGYENSAWVNLV
jgi:hypothetical protein